MPKQHPTYCRVTVLTSQDTIIRLEQNAKYIIRDDERPVKRSRRGKREQTPIVQPLLLGLPLDPEFIKNPHRGVYFGSCSGDCDILLAEDNGGGISGIHLRVVLDYHDESPQNLIIQDISTHQTTTYKAVGNTDEVACNTRKLVPGESAYITVNHVRLRLDFLNVTHDVEGWRHLCQVGKVPSIDALTIKQSQLATPLVLPKRYTMLNFKLGGQRVEKAVDTQEKRAVAIKTTTHSEWRILHSVDHAHIVRVLDSWNISDDNYCIVMDMMHYGTLEDILGQPDQWKKWSRRETRGAVDTSDDTSIAKTVTGQLLQALCFLHNENVIHANVNPASILISEAPPGLHCRLGGFGLAKNHTLGSSRRFVLGSLLYMAPEMASEQQDLDEKIDIYACGKLGLRMLSGVENPPGITSCLEPSDVVEILMGWNPSTALTSQTVNCRATFVPMLAQSAAYRPSANAVLTDNKFLNWLAGIPGSASVNTSQVDHFQRLLESGCDLHSPPIESKASTATSSRSPDHSPIKQALWDALAPSSSVNQYLLATEPSTPYQTTRIA